MALEAGLPVLFVEVDNGTETRPLLAKKLTDYRRFFRRILKDTDQREISLWCTLYDNNVTAPAQADDRRRVRPGR
ncbi:replication-relaxation family protein [Streptomyces sp. ISL-99]|nr:replication-relaxation family protein [Streptomyces sp. ISL-99]